MRKLGKTNTGSIEKYCMPVSTKALFIWLPLSVAMIWSIFSFYYDFTNQKHELFSRSGSVLTIVGAWIAYIELHWSMVADKDGPDGLALFFYPDESLRKYAWISLMYVSVGTAIWGYGDFLF